jgi:hypothetical protein
MTVFTITKDELEEKYDAVKAVVLMGLVNDGLLQAEVATKWAEEHALYVTKKSIFRDIMGLWNKEKAIDDIFFIKLVKSCLSSKPVKLTQEEEEKA